MRFCYLSTQSPYPQDRHLVDGLRELGHEVVEIKEKAELRKKSSDCDAVFIGFTSPLFVLSARFGPNKISGKKMIFNAALSQFEANIISRKEYGPLGYRALKWWLLDFLSFHLSSCVLLESQAQIDFIHRLYFVPRKKLVLSYSGVDEKEFHLDPSVKKNDRFTVLFRGRFLPESGILTVIETAKKLEGSGIDFLVVGHGFMYREVNALLADLAPKNLTLLSERLSSDDLRRLMLQSHLSLGQLADHPRLARTLPCKLFESLALGLPYLTGRNKAVFEILAEGETCIAANPGDADDLAAKILSLRDDKNTLDRIGKAGYDLYKQQLTSKKLSEGVLTGCFK